MDFFKEIEITCMFEIKQFHIIIKIFKFSTKISEKSLITP